MARPASRIQSAPMRRRPMSPLLRLLPLLVLLALIVAAVVFLSRSAHERPTRTIEVDVANAAAAR